MRNAPRTATTGRAGGGFVVHGRDVVTGPRYDPAMPTLQITYLVLPAGVDPDCYESSDLESRTELFNFADEEPVTDVHGQVHEVGPTIGAMTETIRTHLGNGDEGIILKVRSPDEEN